MEEAISSIRHEQQRRLSQQRTSEEKLNSVHAGQQYCPKKIQQLKHVMTQRPQQQHQKQQVAKSTQDPQQVKKQSQSTQPQTSYMQDQQYLREAERLQSKLKTESNRIIEWQVKKEIECSELQRKLNDSEDLAERQRKNLFDLQMNCERVSQEFQEELKNREELEAKVVYTRQICTILQDHYQQLDVTLKTFVETRDHLTTRNKDIMDQFDKLTDNFVCTYKNYQLETDNLKTLLSKERENRVHNINEANRIHQILEHKLEEIAEKLCTEQEKCRTLEEEVANSNCQIQELTDAKNRITQELQEKYLHLKNDFNTVTTEKEDLALNFKNITVDFIKLEETHKINFEEKKMTDEKLQTSLNVITNLEIVNEEHTTLIDKISTEKEVVIQELSKLNEECQQIKDKLNEEIKLNQKLNEEIEEWKCCFNGKCDEVKDQQAKYESDITEMNNVLILEKNMRSCVESDLKENQQSSCNLKDHLKESSKKVQELENQIYDLKNVATTRDMEIEKLTVFAEELKIEKQELHELLLGNETTLKSYMDELEHIKCEKEDLGKKVKDLEEGIAKIYEENCLKSKLLSENDAVLTKTKDELSKVTSEKECLVMDMKKLEEQITIIKTESSLKVKETMMCVEEYKQTYVSQLTDHEEVKKKLKEKLENITKELKAVSTEKTNTKEKLTEQEIHVKKLENHVKELQTEVKKLKENLADEKKKSQYKNEKKKSPIKVQLSPVKSTFPKISRKRANFDDWSDTTDESSIDMTNYNMQVQNLKRSASKRPQSQPGIVTTKKDRSDDTIASTQTADKTKSTSVKYIQPKNPVRKFFKKSAVPHPRTIIDDDIFNF